MWSLRSNGGVTMTDCEDSGPSERPRPARHGWVRACPYVMVVVMAALAARGVDSADAPAVDPEFHAEVTRTYDFQPHTLTSEQINKKSGQLDAFWNKVKADPARYLPLLRPE